MKGNTQLRQENIRRLLGEIRDRAPITKRELQDITGFSWGNISFITNKLLSERYIVPSGKQETSVGRKPEEYDINTAENLIIGVDYHSEGFVLVVTDLRGRPVYSDRRAFPEYDMQLQMSILFDAIDKAIASHEKELIRYIAVGMQGVVDPENGKVLRLGHLVDDSPYPICEVLEQRYQLPAMLIHDPDCAMRAEMSHGALKDSGVSTALLIRLEKRGSGMSIMMNNRLCTGSHGRAGEIGRMLIPYNGESGYTYLDWLTPEPGISYLYRELSGTDADVTYDQVAELARNGDIISMDIFHRLTVGIGMALINVVNLFNPECVVLFGDLRQYADLYMDTLLDLLVENAYDTSVRLLLSDLDNDAAAAGAALWAADRVMNELTFSEMGE